MRATVLVSIVLLAGLASAEPDPAVMSIRTRHLRQSEVNAWYRAVRRHYCVVNGELATLADAGAEALVGKVLRPLDETTLLVQLEDGKHAALKPPTGAVAKAADGDRVECLGWPWKTYRYVTVAGTARQLRSYDYLPMMTYKEFEVFTARGKFLELLPPEPESDFADAADEQPARDRILGPRQGLRVWDDVGGSRREKR